MKLQNVLKNLWEVYSNGDVQEIFIDAFDNVYYTVRGEFNAQNDLFKSSSELDELMDNLLAFAGRKREDAHHGVIILDELNKVHYTLPPLSPNGPTLNFMRFPSQEITWDNLVEWKAITKEGVNLLKDKVTNHKSIIVAGNAGSGRYTLTNIMANSINSDCRIVSMERSNSLQIKSEKLVKLQCPNNKASEMPQLVEAASFMRADYLVADIEGPEVSDLLNLVRAGHSCIGSINGENVFDVIKKLEMKAMNTENLSLEEIRYQIASAFDTIVFQERLEDGSRKVTRIVDIEYKDGKIEVTKIYG